MFKNNKLISRVILNSFNKLSSLGFLLNQRLNLMIDKSI